MFDPGYNTRVARGRELVGWGVNGEGTQKTMVSFFYTHVNKKKETETTKQTYEQVVSTVTSLRLESAYVCVPFSSNTHAHTHIQARSIVKAHKHAHTQRETHRDAQRHTETRRDAQTHRRTDTQTYEEEHTYTHCEVQSGLLY